MTSLSNKTVIRWVVIFLAILIIGLIIFERRSTRIGKRPANPFEYSVESFKAVDRTYIQYTESVDFTFGDFDLRGIAFSNHRLYVVEDNYLLVVSPAGEKLAKLQLPASPTCVAASGAGIFIGFTNYIGRLSLSGEWINTWKSLNDSTLFTSLAISDSTLFAADAGNRRVIRYRIDGTMVDSFDGRQEGESHGFIIPSPYFDLAVDHGELWVVNPGRHTFENYTFDGHLRGYWGKTAITIDGFSGCCNPAQMAILPDGSFVTAEKGMVRIKIHEPSGALSAIVASPDLFEGETHAPDLAVGSSGEIYALDFERKMVRVFERKKQQ